MGPTTQFEIKIMDGLRIFLNNFKPIYMNTIY